MKRIFLIAAIIFSIKSFAQVKIGNNPDAIHLYSILELESTDKVLVVTRMTNTQMLSLTPLNGAIVYNTSEQCLFFFKNNSWLNLCAFENIQETLTSITLNEDLINIDYTDENGNVTQLDLSELDESADITANTSLISTNTTNITSNSSNITTNTSAIASHNTVDGDLSATNELSDLSLTGNILTLSNPATGTNAIDLSGIETNTSITQTTNNTDTEVNSGIATSIATYTSEDGTTTTINETVSKLIDNGDGSYSYSDEKGTTTSFTPSSAVSTTIMVDQSFLAKASVTGDSNQPNQILTLTSQRTDMGWTISGNQVVFNDNADYVEINAMAYMQQNQSNTYARINPVLELLKNGIVVARSASAYQRHGSGHDSSSNTISYVDHNPISGNIYQLRAQQGSSQNDILNIDLGHFDLIAVKKASVVQTIITN